MDQEILLEQIMQYTIGAYEIIPDIQDEIGKEYHLALLPQAHHLASGVFLAAGYLLLPPRAHTIFIIPDDSSQITQMEGTIGPILGQSRAFTKIGTWKPTNTPELSSLQSILQHLAFSHTINQTSVLSCLRVGEQISPAQQKKLFDYLRIHLSDTNIIVIQDLTGSIKISGIFARISKSLAKKPKTIAYTHSSTKDKTTHACILA